MKIKLSLVLFLVVSVNNLFAQDCNTIRSEAIRLEAALDTENPETYYEYANFIGNQKASGNNCINKDITNTLYNIFSNGAYYGSIKCAARLVMISQYGLYNYPYNYTKAYELARSYLKLSYENHSEDPETFNEFGWIIPTLYLVNYPYRNKENTEPELAKAAYWLFNQIKTPVEKETDKNSFKQAKEGYNKVFAHAYLLGSFGETINYTEGIMYTTKVGTSYRDDYIITILKKHEGEAEFSNPAALTIIGATEARRWVFNTDVDEYSNIIYQTNIKSVNSESLFKSEYEKISFSLKEIIDAAYPDYNDISKKWELVSNSRLKEPNAYPQWRFLPKNEQQSLYREALKGEESSLKEKEQFQIYKAMVESGQNNALLPLADAFKNGKGVFPIGSRAIEIYKKAILVESLKEEAAFNLAEIYDGSLEDVEVNWKEAAKYYKMSTNYNPKAYTMLGEMALFGIGGFTKNKETALNYIKKGLDNGDDDARVKFEIVGYIPYTENKVEATNYTISVNNLDELNPRIIPYNKGLSVKVDYNIPQGLEENTLRIYPSQNRSFSLKYSTWSPSATLKDIGQETVTVYIKGGTRQIAVLDLIAEDQDGDVDYDLQIPIAVCFLTKDM